MNQHLGCITTGIRNSITGTVAIMISSRSEIAVIRNIGKTLTIHSIITGMLMGRTEVATAMMTVDAGRTKDISRNNATITVGQDKTEAVSRNNARITVDRVRTADVSRNNTRITVDRVRTVDASKNNARITVDTDRIKGVSRTNAKMTMVITVANRNGQIIVRQ